MGHERLNVGYCSHRHRQRIRQSCQVDIGEEGHRAMNGDEGSYQLSHAYDHFLDHATADRRIKTQKN